MDIREIKKRELLDNFLLRAASEQEEADGAEFLQSWSWGEALQRVGQEVRRLGWFADPGSTELLAVMTAVRRPLGLGFSYWYAPRGPIVSSRFSDAGRELLAGFAAALRKEGGRVLFLRFEPRARLFRLGSRMHSVSGRRSLDEQPSQTLVLDLQLSEDELLAAMHPKTRYNLRLAAKRGVTIRPAGPADWPEIWRLLALTGERDGFRLHAPEHYQNLLAGADDFIQAYLAEQGGQAIAAGIFASFGDKTTYLHGASDNAYRALMAPQLLQWTIICQAKEAGQRYYDFYGIDERRWPGVTRFKKGFGGRVLSYPGTYDWPLSAWGYGAYSRLRRLRRAWR